MKLLLCILIVVSILTSCYPPDPTPKTQPEYWLPTELEGKRCEEVTRENCGIMLENCTDGFSYYCQTNVKVMK